MKKTLQTWSAFILILFLFPIIMNLLPNGTTSATSKLMKEPLKIVYASNVFQEDVQEKQKKALLYFTHNHEAFEPVTKEKSGKVTVSHRTENITKFGEKLQAQLAVNGIETDILPVNNMQELEKKGMPFSKAYHTVRPFVQKQIEESEYDLILDMHRDSIGRDKTTVSYKGENYAKVAFVIGLEHPNYKHNEEMAVKLKAEMEKQVPGITRGLIRKSGAGVDGKYNQDLHPNVLLIELGGIENKEDELNRTIAVVAEAATSILSNKKDAEN
ncbi:stage II sporulation protein P [Sporosarcina pasteurii]|uniref:Stage II sporulation protein P n=1 Tax=Sporosarcina pasteurii TaxID=1474 RepID=A0A380BPZ1_SPOPA|nr:stage II sporulation protein P [Sporosarcina pasteurii]MDS9471009.1 stage II sporulation protein P [Sporosarcina pasteurii]QBQ05342.1 stage II sporulation protein P [Sporosarcina pasteurii]SUJ03934.1 stage II sporulation protein P [Sporosarcina pasteurii]